MPRQACRTGPAGRRAPAALLFLVGQRIKELIDLVNVREKTVLLAVYVTDHDARESPQSLGVTRVLSLAYSAPVAADQAGVPLIQLHLREVLALSGENGILG